MEPSNKGKQIKSFASLKNRSSLLSNSRPSSRGGPDLTGQGNCLINYSQDEQTVITSMKSDLLSVQEEINKLDIDGKLRASAFISDPMRKPYFSALKKLIAGSCEINTKDFIEAKGFISPDIEKICEIMRVSNSSDAAKKLFKLLSAFDLFVSKWQELEILMFLQYDELFQELVEQKGESDTRLNSIGSSTRFYLQ